MIFLDSSDIKKIRKYNQMGIIRGVTTNPTIMKKDNISQDTGSLIEAIAREMNPCPVSVEVSSNDNYKILQEAKKFSDIRDNVNIKIPIHGTTGRTNNLGIIRNLSKRGISINVTAMMSAHQCYLASLADADYVSLFCGRIADMGHDEIYEIRRAKELLMREKPQTELIGASVREVKNVADWLLAGCDIVTVTPNILEKMIVHPRTKETVTQFLNDAKKLKERKKE